MKIRLLKQVNGAWGAGSAGEVVSAPHDIAVALIRARAAEQTESAEMPSVETESVDEVATVEPTETASVEP